MKIFARCLQFLISGLLVILPVCEGFAESALITRWNFNQTNTLDASFGSGTIRTTGVLSITYAPGTGSSDPVGTLDFALNLSKVPATTNALPDTGLEVDTAVNGYRNIAICFDIRPTGSSARRLIIQAPSGESWKPVGEITLTNANIFTNGVTFLFPELDIPASGLLRFRITPAPDPDGILRGVSGRFSGSGAWRLDMLTVSGEPIAGGTPPRFASVPSAITNRQGSTVTLRPEVVGTEPIHFQWTQNGTSLGRETNSILKLTKISPSNAGTYRLTASNAWGSAITTGIEVRVVVDPVVAPSPVPSLIHQLTLVSRSGDALTNAYRELVLHPGDSVASTIQLDASISPGIGDESLWITPPDARKSRDPDHQSATLFWSPTEADGGRLHVVVIPVGTDTVRWSIYVPTPAERQLVITELLANPVADPTNPRFNPLARDLSGIDSWDASNDEFVELVQTGADRLTLEGWTLSDATKVRHRFSGEWFLGSGESVVIHGGPETNLPPTAGIRSTPASQGGGLGLNNTGDEIWIRNAESNLVTRVVYTSRQIGTNGSLTRLNPDDPFQSHRNLGGRFASPGSRADGATWSEALGTSGSSREFRWQCRLESREGTSLLLLEWAGSDARQVFIDRSSTPDGPFEFHASKPNPGGMELPFSDIGSGFFRIRAE